MEIPIKKLSEYAKIPVRSSSGAAGYDLFAAKNVTFLGWTRYLIPTDISIAIPTGYYGRIAPRSSLALKNCVDVAAGVIDEDYRGNVGVILCNNSNNSYTINIGDRIAQLIIEKIAHPQFVEVEPSETIRADGGFGSTGR